MFKAIKNAYRDDPYVTMIILGLPILGHVFESTMGFYKLKYLSFFLIFLGFFYHSIFRRYQIGPKVITLFHEKIIYLNLLFWAFMMAANPHFEAPVNKSLMMYCRISYILNFLVVILITIKYFDWKKFPFNNKIAIFGESKLIGISLFLMAHTYLIVPYVTPQSTMDVFLVIDKGADDLLKGLNPYSHMYPILNMWTGKFWESGYCYWPTVLITTTLSKFLFGDVRHIYSIFTFISTYWLYKLALKYKWKPNLAKLICLTWLTFPTVILTLELTWNEFVLIFCFAGFAYFLFQNAWVRSALFFGALMGSKQYTIFFALMLGPYLIKNKGWGFTIKYVLTSLISFSVLMGPFLYWNFSDFYFYTVTYLENVVEREDSLTIVAFMKNNFKFVMNRYGYSIIYGISTLGLITYLMLKKHTSSRLMIIMYIMYSLIFIFGKQAFINYYYFLMYIYFMILVTTVSSQLRDSYE